VACICIFVSHKLLTQHFTCGLTQNCKCNFGLGRWVLQLIAISIHLCLSIPLPIHLWQLTKGTFIVARYIYTPYIRKRIFARPAIKYKAGQMAFPMKHENFIKLGFFLFLLKDLPGGRKAAKGSTLVTHGKSH